MTDKEFARKLAVISPNLLDIVNNLFQWEQWTGKMAINQINKNKRWQLILHWEQNELLKNIQVLIKSYQSLKV